MAPKPSTSKSATKKVAKHFASKVVKDVLDNMIESKIASEIQNPKTFEKWASKMKLSVLKKLSAASKLAFVPKASSALGLRSEILALKQKIVEQTQGIRDNAVLHIKKSKLSEIELPVGDDIHPNGRFDVQAESIKDQFGEVANQLASNLVDIPSCVQALKSSVDATDSDWRHVSLLLSSNVTKSQTTKKIGESPNSCKLPVEVLYNHLGKS